jgi:hypothetical protein
VRLFRRFAGGQDLDGFTSVRKWRAKVHVEMDTKVTFMDITEVSDAKFELQEIVAFQGWIERDPWMLPEYIAGLRKIDGELLQPAIKSEDDMTDIDVGGLAMVVLGCKVAELGKQQSQPTKEQTFARVYEDPKNSEIAKVERRAEELPAPRRTTPAVAFDGD